MGRLPSVRSEVVELDLEAETAALREKSPFATRSILVTIVVILILGACAVVVAVLENEPWLYLAVAVIAAIGGGLVFYFSRKARGLIETGVILEAAPTSIMRFGRGLHRISIVYEFERETIQSALYVDSATCGAIEGAGFVWVVVAPESPRTVAALYSFAGLRDGLYVASGLRGLASEAANARSSRD